jgi:MFS family permease
MASEMLYPVMPVYLRQLGFSILLIGVLEGLAESVAGLSKAYFGGLSDKQGRRLPFVRWGYSLSALSKPMMAVFTGIPGIFTARTADRLGKGIRTAARDAMLNDEATKSDRAAIFGFHRALDTLGAVLGPILSLAFLEFHPGNYRLLFLLAFIPGLLAILLTLRVKEKAGMPVAGRRVGWLHAFRYWREATPEYRRLTAGLLLFALANSSDMLLLLRVREAGYTDRQVIGVYVFYNLVYALLSFPIGRLADRIGIRRVFVTGLVCFAATYAGASGTWPIGGWLFLFFTYGIYAAATEGISKAWIGGLVGKAETASAIGTYTAFQSIASLAASSLAGLLWYRFGPAAAFLASAAVALFVALYLSRQGGMK